MSRGKRRRRPRVLFPGEAQQAAIGTRPPIGVRSPSAKTDPAPPAFKVRSLSEKLRDAQGELFERAEGARMGAALLAESGAFPEAARFLEGISRASSAAAQRLKNELDDDEIPF